MEEALLIRSTGAWYEVLLASGAVMPVRIRGRLRLKGVRTTNPVAVGDRVMIEDGAIAEILPRRNYLIRRASNLSRESHILAANIDRALLVCTLRTPATPVEFIDRFLVTCQAYHVPVTLVLSKADLLTSEQIDSFSAVYDAYEVLPVSSLTGRGIEALRKLTAGRTTLLAGNSGVGKSTLAATLEPGLDLKTAAVSESHGKGRHTTTYAAMYPLKEGGWLVDTPGVKGFGLIDIADEELSHYFPEMHEVSKACRFYNCTHVHEPGCAVIEAVEAGRIPASRYESYLKILNEDGKYR